MVIDFMDNQEIERAHLLGLHTGNKIGAAIAAGWPQRISSLMIAGHTHSLIADPQSRDAAIHALSDHYPPHYAEARVIDYLLGRHSIRAMYNAIFDFDFNAALAQLEAPTLVLELLTPDEAHHGEQAAKVCSLMKRAQAARVENGDRLSLEKNPLAIVTPILDFLRSQR